MGSNWGDRALRDLQWAIESPSLVTPPDQKTTWIETKDWERFRQPLQSFLKQAPSYLVGKYFESLVHFWLEHVQGVSIVAAQKQISHERRTRGEIDFVFRTAEDQLIHWETAVKFYLYDKLSSSFDSHYIGPNNRDTFERKIRRLNEVQIPLGKEIFPDVTSQSGFVKGRIYYHPHQAPPKTFPEHLSARHERAIWIRAGEFDQFVSQQAFTRYCLLKKPYWLAPESFHSSADESLPKDQILEQTIQHFRTSTMPLHLAAFEESIPDARETARLFIVADAWPATAITT